MKIMGIDQSYTNTGIVVLDKKQQLIHAETFTSNANDSIYKRAWEVANHIQYVVEKYKPDIIGLEGLAFGMKGDATRDLAGLQFAIYICVSIINGNKINVVSPNTVKKTATGSGKSKKTEMLEFLPENIHKKFLNLGVKKTTGLMDLNDAYWIAITILEQHLEMGEK